MDTLQSLVLFISWPTWVVSVLLVWVGGMIGWLCSSRKVNCAERDLAKLRVDYKKSLEAVELDAQEAERKRIAADLHDNIISKLTLLRLNNANEVGLNDTLGDIIEEARYLCHDLMPPLYEEMGLDEILMNIIAQWKSSYHLIYDTDIRATMSNNRLKLQITRIFQELMTNVHKHAQATSIAVGLRITASSVAMLVTDDGTGFDGRTKGRGIGLINLQRRIEGLGGKYKFKKAADEGTRFIFFMKTSSSPATNQ